MGIPAANRWNCSGLLLHLTSIQTQRSNSVQRKKKWTLVEIWGFSGEIPFVLKSVIHIPFFFLFPQCPAWHSHTSITGFYSELLGSNWGLDCNARVKGTRALFEPAIISAGTKTQGKKVWRCPERYEGVSLGKPGWPCLASQLHFCRVLTGFILDYVPVGGFETLEGLKDHWSTFWNSAGKRKTLSLHKLSKTLEYFISF